jgi:hypothetical protein
VCGPHTDLEIIEDEWVHLIKMLGSIKGLQNLTLRCTSGSRNFHPLQAVASALNNARSLHRLEIAQEREPFPRDPSELFALANALREHTALEEFGWVDFCQRLEAEQNTTIDPVLRALRACPHLRKVVIMTKYACVDAIKNLLQLPSAIELHLVLENEHWLAVADEIRRGRCNVVQRLILVMLQVTISDATEAVKAVASAIRLDCNLEHLYLRMENGFSDEAGVALATALTVNKTLCKITLSVRPVFTDGILFPDVGLLGAPAYAAFGDMLCVNTSLVLKLPAFESAGADERLKKHYHQMVIEQRLNKAGRGRLLASKQTTTVEYVDALSELNSYNVDNSSPALQVSCLYSLLRLYPAVVCMS